MFFLGGLGSGFAAPGGWKWLPLAFPLGLFVIAVLQEGADGTVETAHTHRMARKSPSKAPKKCPKCEVFFSLSGEDVWNVA
jgi:hypothetical protein